MTSQYPRPVTARVSAVPTGVRDGAELLPPSAPRRIETPPPIGFNYNRGPNYVPCIINDNSGRSIPACFTRVVMGADPHVIGMIPGNHNQYGGPLHATPDHDLGERPRYTPDDLWQFKVGADNAGRFNLALDYCYVPYNFPLLFLSHMSHYDSSFTFSHESL